MNIFSTNFLMKVLSLMKTPSSFILDRYFGQISTSESEEISFDVISGDYSMAPFVSPVVAGKVVQEQGREVKTFKPAYLKPKTPLLPGGALKRAAGERIGGELSASDRQQARIAMTMLDHLSKIGRRLEWMAVQALLNGKVTVKGDNYPESVVDFGRDAELTIVKTAGTYWTDEDVSVLDDLQEWSLLLQEKSGRAGMDLLMPAKVWSVIKKKPEIKDRLDTKNINNNSLNTDSVAQIGGKFQGSIDGFNFFTYTEFYKDDDTGETKPMIPSNQVILTSQGVEGVQAFGAIMDEKAGLKAIPYFPKSWVPEDPAIRQVMTQSAPLVVPTNVNASMSATVIAE